MIFRRRLALAVRLLVVEVGFVDDDDDDDNGEDESEDGEVDGVL